MADLEFYRRFHIGFFGKGGSRIPDKLSRQLRADAMVLVPDCRRAPQVVRGVCDGLQQDFVTNGVVTVAENGESYEVASVYGFTYLLVLHEHHPPRAKLGRWRLLVFYLYPSMDRYADVESVARAASEAFLPKLHELGVLTGASPSRR